MKLDARCDGQPKSLERTAHGFGVSGGAHSANVALVFDVPVAAVSTQDRGGSTTTRCASASRSAAQSAHLAPEHAPGASETRMDVRRGRKRIARALGVGDDGTRGIFGYVGRGASLIVRL